MTCPSEQVPLANKTRTRIWTYPCPQRRWGGKLVLPLILVRSRPGTRAQPRRSTQSGSAPAVSTAGASNTGRSDHRRSIEGHEMIWAMTSFFFGGMGPIPIYSMGIRNKPLADQTRGLESKRQMMHVCYPRKRSDSRNYPSPDGEETGVIAKGQATADDGTPAKPHHPRSPHRSA